MKHVCSGQITISDANDGVNMVFVPSSIVLQATNAGVVSSYATAKADVSVMLGGTDVTTLYDLTLSSASGCTATLASGTVSVSAMSASNATVTVTATRLGWSTLTAALTLAKANAGSTGSTGSTGQRGTVQLSRAITGTAWSNTEAGLALSGANYDPPILGDVVTLYNSAAKYSEGRAWSGTAWLKLSSWISGNMLIDGTLIASKIAAGTIETEQLKVGAATNTYVYDFTSDTGIMAANGGSPYVEINLDTFTFAGVNATIDVDVQVRLGESTTAAYTFPDNSSVLSSVSLKLDTTTVDVSYDHRNVCPKSSYNSINVRHRLCYRGDFSAVTKSINVRVYAYLYNSTGTQVTGHTPYYNISAKLFITENKV